MANQTIYRGNNKPLIWRFLQDDGSIFDLAGSELVLYAIYDSAAERELAGDGAIEKSSIDDSDDLTVDVATGLVTWTPTADESRLFPLRTRCEYEIERRIDDTETTIASGLIIARGGNNSDG